MLHGREKRLHLPEDLRPLEDQKGDATVTSPVCEHLECLKKRFRDAYEIAGKRRDQSHAKNKRLHDRQAKATTFGEGDLVCFRQLENKEMHINSEGTGPRNIKLPANALFNL
jgi:rRNA-processing protein FCF1